MYVHVCFHNVHVACVRTCVCTYIHVCVHVACVRTCVCACGMCTYMCVCMWHVYVHVCVHVYIIHTEYVCVFIMCMCSHDVSCRLRQ